MASRSLEDADPKLKDGFVRIKDIFESVFPRYELRPTCTLRSDAEQIEAFTSGHSRIDPRVPAQRAKAMHLAVNGKSRAIDVGIFRRNPRGLPASYIDELLESGKFDSDLHTALYWCFAQLAQRFGFRSGFDWDGDGMPVGPDPDESLNDPYHFELRG